MKIEEIPSDELIIMTEFWHKAFNAAGCNPTCHCCHKNIKVDEFFKLATILEAAQPNTGSRSGLVSFFKELLELLKANKPKEGFVSSKEVMLCDTCTSEEYKNNEIKEAESDFKYRSDAKKHRGDGCFRINGKIVT